MKMPPKKSDKVICFADTHYARPFQQNRSREDIAPEKNRRKMNASILLTEPLQKAAIDTIWNEPSKMAS